MRISIPGKSDIEQIVRVHIDAFPNFFLTSLGAGFLKTYYRAYLDNTDALLICAKENGAVIGFAATAVFSQGFNKQLIMRNWSSFLVQGVKLMLIRPKALLHLLKNMEKTNNGKDEDVKETADYAELYSIAVASGVQGKGVGRALMLETESELKRRSIVKLSLTTDSDNNHKTLAFYNSAGFNPLYEFVAYPNRRMVRMIKSL